MKTYNELTEEQRMKAVALAMTEALTLILEGIMKFSDDDGFGLQAAIDEAIAEADRMRTPWFAHEYIMEARFDPGKKYPGAVEADGKIPVADAIRAMCVGEAEDALYAEEGENVVDLWAVEAVQL